TAPAWLTQPAPHAAVTPEFLSPSHAFDETASIVAMPATADSSPRQRALVRGRLLHRLMQSLPDVPSAHRAEAARRYLARSGKELTGAEHDVIVMQALRVLDDERFAALFAPGSRAEVPIVGRLMRGGRPVIVSGQIDRLAVTDGAVLIGDFKTNS